MGLAPKPGTFRARKRDDIVIRVTWDGRELAYRNGDLGPADHLAFRQATGLRYHSLFESGDAILTTEAFTAAWWMARRKNGDRASWATVLGELGTDEAIGQAFDAGAADFQVDAVDEEAADDPLPSGGD